jgi:hypothetical protein
MMMEVIRSYETTAFTSTTLRNIPEDGILHNHRRVNLKSTKNTGNSELLELLNMFSVSVSR